MTKKAVAKKPAQPTTPMERYVEEIDKFAGMLREQQDGIRDLEKETAIAKTVYDECRDKLRDAKENEHCTVSLLLKFIRPGSIDVMPLFDTMDEADEEVHGVNSDDWRKEPVIVLDLSTIALRTLIDADVVLVGQLQDRILKGEEWAADLEGINEGMAQAIEAKLAQFIDERAKGKKK